MNSKNAVAGLTMVLLFCSVNLVRAQNWKLLFDLRGQWKFEIGDDMHRAEPGFDDSKWESIHAPAAWEDEGFPGYDGYAWYRKHFRSSSDWKEKSLSLNMGNVDDVDEVYLNGHLVGSTGSFPPHYSTAYDVNRIYTFAPAFLNPAGDNVVAVRVYDNELSGGITRGSLGVYEDINALRVDVPINAEWKFKIGDDPSWKNIQYDDTRWNTIVVPEYWEPQGYPDYDGFAWYRVKFRVPSELLDKRLILLLGKIDDFDETFLNGELIGRTGAMESRAKDIPGSDAYTQLRAYYIPPEDLRRGEDNVLAVRVYDGFKNGGIYSGPIGIVLREKYLRWSDRNANRHDGFFDWLFK